MLVFVSVAELAGSAIPSTPPGIRRRPLVGITRVGQKEIGIFVSSLTAHTDKWFKQYTLAMVAYDKFCNKNTRLGQKELELN